MASSPSSAPSSFPRSLRKSFAKRRFSRGSDDLTVPDVPPASTNPLHLDPFADIMPPKSLLTLTFSSHSFLDSTVHTETAHQEPPLYVVETVGRQTTVYRNDPAGVSLVGIVRWPKSAAPKGKESIRSGITIQIGKGRARDADDFLQFSSLLTSRKFNLPHHPYSVKWKVVGKAYHCTTASVKKEIAILEPANLAAPPRLRITNTLSKDRDPSRPQPEHKGVPIVLIDYIFMTAMILVTQETEWMNVSQPINLDEDEHYAPSIHDTLHGVHVTRIPSPPLTAPSSIQDWRRGVSQEPYARPPSPTSSYSSSQSGQRSRGSVYSTDFSPLSSSGRSDPANSRFPPVPPIPAHYQSHPASPLSEGTPFFSRNTSAPHLSITLAAIGEASTGPSEGYSSSNPQVPRTPRSVSGGSTSGRRSLPRPPGDNGTQPPSALPTVSSSSQPWLRQSFAVESLYGSLPSHGIPPLPSMPEHCPCEACRPGILAFITLERSGNLRNEKCGCHKCTSRLQHSHSFTHERPSVKNVPSPLSPPSGPIQPLPPVPTFAQQQPTPPLGASQHSHWPAQDADPSGSRPPPPVPQKDHYLPPKLMAEFNLPGVSRAPESQLVGSSSHVSPPAPAEQSHVSPELARQRHQTLLGIPPLPPLSHVQSSPALVPPTSTTPHTSAYAPSISYAQSSHAPSTATTFPLQGQGDSVAALTEQATRLGLSDFQYQDNVVYDLPPPSYESLQVQLPPQRPPTTAHF